jgi:hypothetical protein
MYRYQQTTSGVEIIKDDWHIGYVYEVEKAKEIVEACNNFKSLETNNKNQAQELDKAYEMIGELQKIVDKYQNEEIIRLAGGE